MQFHVLAVVAVAALMAAKMGSAHAAPLVRLDFTGTVDIDRLYVGTDRTTPSTAPDPLSGVIDQLSSPLSAVRGFVLYDAGTPATSPGVWNLPTATYQATFGNLAISATGLTAIVNGASNSALQFRFGIPSGEFTFPVTAANGSLSITTFSDNAFNLTSLPTAIPTSRPDESTDFSYTTPISGGLNGFVSTGTILRITATVVDGQANVPEPASLFLLGAGLASLAAASRRGKLPSSGC